MRGRLLHTINSLARRRFIETNAQYAKLDV